MEKLFIDPNNNNKVFLMKMTFNKIKLVDFADIENIIDKVIYQKKMKKEFTKIFV